MTENKRFTVHIVWLNYDKTEGEITLKDNGQPLLMADCVEDVQMVKGLLNELHEENQRLKAMLKNNVDEGICNICKYFYLEVHEDVPQYYIGKCEKGHEKASKEDVKYCDDFDLKKELKE